MVFRLLLVYAALSVRKAMLAFVLVKFFAEVAQINFDMTVRYADVVRSLSNLKLPFDLLIGADGAFWRLGRGSDTIVDFRKDA